MIFYNKYKNFYYVLSQFLSNTIFFNIYTLTLFTLSISVGWGVKWCAVSRIMTPDRFTGGLERAARETSKFPNWSHLAYLNQKLSWGFLVACRRSVSLSVNFAHFHLLQNNRANSSQDMAQGVLGYMKDHALFQREIIAKIHWRNLKILSRTVDIQTWHKAFFGEETATCYGLGHSLCIVR